MHESKFFCDMQKLTLQQFSTLTMESLGYISHDSPKAGSRYDVVGELRFSQKEPLKHTGTDNRYNVSVVIICLLKSHYMMHSARVQYFSISDVMIWPR